MSPVASPTLSAQPERVAVSFAELLRRSGLAVGFDAAVVYAQALSVVGLARREPVYWAGRATLVRRPEDVPAYDRAFSAFWLGRERLRELVELRIEPLTLLVDTEDQVAEDAGREGPEPDAADGAGREVRLRYSSAEILARKDFATCSPAELAEAQRLLASFALSGPLRRTRRRRPSHKRAREPDLRRTLRQAMRTGGEPVARAFTEPGEHPRSVVLLCDVSGSMEIYARVLLRFLHVAVSGRGEVEAFTLGTRLTRITRELSRHDPDEALAQAAAAVPDWSSGTRLGEVLREFNDRWGTRGLARGAVVVILSDGWDRGDPELLAGEMGRLSRVAQKIVWVNPLKATPGYSPIARGMAAALPFVDELMEGHSLASLEALIEVVGR